MNFSEVLKRRVAPVVLAASISGSVLSASPVVAHAQTNDKSIVTEDEEKSRLSDFFATKEEAEEWIRDRVKILQTVYNITGTKIYLYKGQTTEIETVPIDETYSTEKEALDRLKELNDDDYYSPDVVINEIKGNNKLVETVEVNILFSTMEDLVKYKESLNNKEGLKLTIKEIPNDWEYGEEEKVIDISSDSLEELQEEIDAIKAKISSEETPNLSYDVRVSITTNEEVVPTLVNVENFTNTFDTKEQIQEFIDSKEEEVSGDKDKYYEFGEISERSVFSHNETTDINEIFSTIEEMNLYKDNLVSEGYILSDLEETIETDAINETIETGNLLINSLNKLLPDSHYEVYGNYMVIKQTSDNVVVWTPDVLTDDQMSSFKESFINLDCDSSILESTNFVFVSGSEEVDLSTIDPSFGIYKIQYIDGLITLDCSSDNISYLDYGTYENEVKTEQNEVRYKLVGKKSIPVNKTVYDMNYSLKTQEYETKKTYYASIYRTRKTNTTKYNLIGEYKEVKEEPVITYNVIGRMIRTTHKDRYRAEIKYRLKTKEEIRAEQEKILKEKQNKEQEVPKTSDDSNVALYSAALAGSVIGLLSVKKKVKRK